MQSSIDSVVLRRFRVPARVALHAISEEAVQLVAMRGIAKLFAGNREERGEIFVHLTRQQLQKRIEVLADEFEGTSSVWT